VNVGLAPPAWQWRLGEEIVVINTYPSGLWHVVTRSESGRAVRPRPFFLSQMPSALPLPLLSVFKQIQGLMGSPLLSVGT
jgi:hypothetical protein